MEYFDYGCPKLVDLLELPFQVLLGVEPSTGWKVPGGENELF